MSKWRILVIGVGGGGCNAVAAMMSTNIRGVEFVAANTDAQVLDQHPAPVRIQLGEALTRGLGAGGDPDVGRRAALESEEVLRQALAGADLVFVATGMGGGTGTGAAPVVARIARELGALTIGVVTRPFRIEGGRRARRALEGIDALRAAASAVLVVANDRILAARGNGAWNEAFRLADDVLTQAVRGVSDIVFRLGALNVDLQDLRRVFEIPGGVVLGFGRATGQRAPLEAAKAAIAGSLLDDPSIDGALGLLVNIRAGSAHSMLALEEAADSIQGLVDEFAEYKLGLDPDDALGDEVFVTVVATGIGIDRRARREPLLAPKSRAAEDDGRVVRMPLLRPASSPPAAPAPPRATPAPFFRSPSPEHGARRVQERAAAYNSARDAHVDHPSFPGFEQDD